MGGLRVADGEWLMAISHTRYAIRYLLSSAAIVSSIKFTAARSGSAGIIARNLYGLYRVAYNDLAKFNSEKEAHR